MGKKKQKDRRGKYRNWRAVAAHDRKSAGPMKNKNKERERKICREPIEYEEETENKDGYRD